MTSIPAVSERIRWVPRLGQTSQAAAWTFFAFGATQVLRLASNVLLAHLLFPEAFGLTAIAGAILAGLQMFSDIGLAPSLVRSARGEDPAFRNTAWTLGVIRGLILWAFAAALAYPVGQFYDPQLAKILPVAGSVCLIAALASTSLAVLGRRMHLRGVTLLDLGSTALGIVITCVWAWLSPTVWSIIGGALFAAAARTVISWMLVPGHRDRFMLEREAVREIMGFGRWILISTIITFIVLQADRLLLGKLFSIEDLGVYSIAISLVVMPRDLVSRLASAVQFPMLARTARVEAHSMEAVLAQTRGPLLLFTLWIMLAIGLGAQSFFNLLYDSRYEQAVWITQLLCVPIFFGVVMQTSGYALLAAGDSRGLAVSNGVRALSVVPACLVGYSLGGLAGFIGGLAVSAVAGHTAQIVALRRHGLQIAATDAWFVLAFNVLLWGPLWCAWSMPVFGTWHGIDLTIAALGASVLVPLGIFTAARLRSLLKHRRGATFPREGHVVPVIQAE